MGRDQRSGVPARQGRDRRRAGAGHATPAVPTVRPSSRRLLDLVAAWKDATTAERARIVSSILAVIVVKDRKIESFRPRPGWAPYFEEIAVVSSERETGLEPSQDTSLRGKRILPMAG